MFNLIPSAGYAVASLDFTNSGTLLISGLVTLVWLLAGLIAGTALRGRFIDTVVTQKESGGVEVVYRQAA